MVSIGKNRKAEAASAKSGLLSPIAIRTLYWTAFGILMIILINLSSNINDEAVPATVKSPTIRSMNNGAIHISPPREQTQKVYEFQDKLIDTVYKQNDEDDGDASTDAPTDEATEDSTEDSTDDTTEEGVDSGDEDKEQEMENLNPPQVQSILDPNEFQPDNDAVQNTDEDTGGFTQNGDDETNKDPIEPTPFIGDENAPDKRRAAVDKLQIEPAEGKDKPGEEREDDAEKDDADENENEEEEENQDTHEEEKED